MRYRVSCLEVISVEAPELVRLRPNTEFPDQVCHAVAYEGAPTSLCGIPRSEFSMDCAYTDYCQDNTCKCNKPFCPECERLWSL